MTKLKDICKAQVLYDALMIVTGGKKYVIRDICDRLDGYDEIGTEAARINVHLIEQGY